MMGTFSPDAAFVGFHLVNMPAVPSCTLPRDLVVGSDDSPCMSHIETLVKSDETGWAA